MWACILFLVLFQTLPHGRPNMYVLCCPIVGPNHILILPFSRLWTCMYDCPIVGLRCVLWYCLLVGSDVCMPLPLGRLRCMCEYCLLVGLDVCFLILPLGRLKCMFASSTLAFISRLHHCCYSCIVAFLEQWHSCTSLYSIFTCIVPYFHGFIDKIWYWLTYKRRRKRDRLHKIKLPQYRFYAVLNMRGNVPSWIDLSLYLKFWFWSY